MAAPANAATTMQDVVGWISVNLGWFYVLTVTLVILFVLWVAFSKEGSVRLGPDHSRPQYKLFTWVAMLFAAGVGHRHALLLRHRADHAVRRPSVG